MSRQAFTFAVLLLALCSGDIGAQAGSPASARAVDTGRQHLGGSADRLKSTLSPAFLRAGTRGALKLVLEHHVGPASLPRTHFRWRIGQGPWSDWIPYELKPTVTVNELGPQLGGCEDRPSHLKYRVEMELGRRAARQPGQALVIESTGLLLGGHACLFISG